MPLTEQLRQWRRQGDFASARKLLQVLLQAHPADASLRVLAWEHEPFWWEPVRGRRLQLIRRGPADLAFVRACWNDTAFMQRFNRTAPALATEDAQLGDLLRREQATIVSESNALHWTIRSNEGAIGLLSVVNMHPTHRRGEFLIGLRGKHGPWDGAEAAHLSFEFLAHRAGIERLTAHFYLDNPRATRSALKLGFEHEGTLRGHLRLNDGRRQDLHVAGLLLTPEFFERTARIRHRLLDATHGV